MNWTAAQRKKTFGSDAYRYIGNKNMAEHVQLVNC